MSGVTTRTLDYLPLDDIPRAPVNPKNHRLDVIEASIGRHGYAEPVLLDERTGRLIGGHGRLDTLAAMRAAGEDPPEGIGPDWTVPVIRGWASKSDLDAAAMLVTLNRATELGGWDTPDLHGLLTGIGDLTGVGYDDADLEVMRRLIHATSDLPFDVQREWQQAGMGDFDNDDGTPALQDRVSFQTEADFDRFRELLGMTGPRRTRIWFPEQPDLIESDEEFGATPA